MERIDALAGRYSMLRASGSSMEEIISALHDEGVSILQSILVIAAVFDLPTSEAKAVVTAHPEWRALADTVDAAHEAVARQLRETQEWDPNCS